MPRFFLSLLLGLSLVLPAFAAANTLAEAEALLKDRDPRAAEVVAALAKARPDDRDVRILQIRALLQQRGKAEQALELAEELADDEPDYGPAHLWLGNAYGNRIGEVGTFGQATMAPKLRRAFERALELDPGLHDARSALLEYYLQAPAIVGGSVAKAKAQVAELQRRDPPRGHYALGRVAQYEERLDDARRHYLDAYTARPTNAVYRMSAGIIHQDAEDWARAFAVFGDWTRDEPKAAGAWYQLGRTAVLSGQRLDEGVAAFRRFLALPEQPGQPEHKYAWWRLGQALALAGDKAAARQALQEALALDPGLAEAKAELAKL
ncbi:tetratricopeptide repeat protein [Arenimonas sp.]|uniref:tetratricopeptide repeat protein n=1 Tax=Arenimonas sp. TaxID=1872635 RepID=UPI0035B0B44C